MSPAVYLAAQIAIYVHLALMVPCIFQVWRGENPQARLLALDVLGVMAIAVIVLLSITRQQPMFVEVALGLALVGFIGSMLLARLLAMPVNPDSEDQTP